MARKPEAIFFDVGNTLLFPNWECILSPLTKRGVVPTQAQLQEVERQTKEEFDQLAARRSLDRDFWSLFYARLFDVLGLRDAENLVTLLTAATRTSSNWNRVLPGTREALDRIGASFRIGIISNADGAIDRVLKACGLCDCFLSITDSGAVGYEKPHPAIFAHAAKTMGVAPGNALYVGDLYSVDWSGATNAGMNAILFDVAGAYRETRLPRVESLNELETRLRAI
jgi:putative hydrolase of the HAD superfamily